ncbi:MAG: hypothetical protein O3A46_11355, partial [Candidatus Poribacteria bacterium]|nr:hypothetical protein [Candidatus Poribacteria bacterium]
MTTVRNQTPRPRRQNTRHADNDSQERDEYGERYSDSGDGREYFEGFDSTLAELGLAVSNDSDDSGETTKFGFAPVSTLDDDTDEDDDDDDDKEGDGFLTSLLENATVDWSSDDPIKVYLREMGKVPLLTKDQEVQLSKEIEDGQKIVRDAVYETNIAITEMRKLLNAVVKEKIRPAEILDLPTQARSGRGTRYIRMARQTLDGLNETELLVRQIQRNLRNAELTDDARGELEESHLETRKAIVKLLRRIKLNREQINSMADRVKELAKQVQRLHSRLGHMQRETKLTCDQILEIVAKGKKRSIPEGLSWEHLNLDAREIIRTRRT